MSCIIISKLITQLLFHQPELNDGLVIHSYYELAHIPCLIVITYSSQTIFGVITCVRI